MVTRLLWFFESIDEENESTGNEHIVFTVVDVPQS